VIRSSETPSDVASILAAALAGQKAQPSTIVATPVAKLPGIAAMLFDVALYAALEMSQADRKRVVDLMRGSFKVDGHCLRCTRESVFQGANPSTSESEFDLLRDENWEVGVRSFDISARCFRCGNVYRFYFRRAGTSLIKVGQFPSIEDVSSADLLRFRNAMDKQDFAEMRRAGGLYSHGIGVGSFVYLRRIFERMMTKHHREMVDEGLSVEGYDQARGMSDRIRALKAGLPPALVKHAAAYGILSKGIHELDEETCKKHFPIVRAAILQILEQDLRRREEKRAEADLERELATISGELGKTTDL